MNKRPHLPQDIFNNTLKTKYIPDSWHETKIVFLFKKGDPKDIKNYRPISFLSHSYKIFIRLLQTRIERTLDEIQPIECGRVERIGKKVVGRE